MKLCNNVEVESSAGDAVFRACFWNAIYMSGDFDEEGAVEFYCVGLYNKKYTRT